jgi:OmpA-OmpF porin, OOP family
MHYCFLVAVLLLNASFTAHAQSGQPTSNPGLKTPDNASLEGTIVHAQTRQPLAGATIVVRVVGSSAPGVSQRVGANGAFAFRLDPRQPYQLLTRADGFLPVEERLAFTSTFTNRLFGKVVALQPIANAVVVGTKTALKALQFAQSTANLLPDAQPELNRLLTLLRDRPTMQIELGGHTDNQGDFDANVRLSKQRADTVRAWLLRSGIAPARIQTRGYGPTRPLTTSLRDDIRQQNRRVEMTVLRE